MRQIAAGITRRRKTCRARARTLTKSKNSPGWKILIHEKKNGGDERCGSFLSMIEILRQFCVGWQRTEAGFWSAAVDQRPRNWVLVGLLVLVLFHLFGSFSHLNDISFNFFLADSKFEKLTLSSTVHHSINCATVAQMNLVQNMFYINVLNTYIAKNSNLAADLGPVLVDLLVFNWSSRT